MSDSTAVTKAAAWPTRTKKYVGELRDEMKLVTWPSWKQVRATTAVVIVSVFLFAAYFFVVDSAVGAVINRLFSSLTQ